MTTNEQKLIRLKVNTKVKKLQKKHKGSEFWKEYELYINSLPSKEKLYCRNIYTRTVLNHLKINL